MNKENPVEVFPARFPARSPARSRGAFPRRVSPAGGFSAARFSLAWSTLK